MKKLIPLIAVTLALGTHALAHDRAGNGGEFKEMEFVTLAYEDLDVLRELNKTSSVPVDLALYAKNLQSLRVNFKNQVELPDGPRSAANYPDEVSIDVDNEAWDKSPDKFSRLNLVLHEMLWISKVVDKAYVVSTPLFARMKPLILKRSDQPSKTPVLLYSKDMDQTQSGMDFGTAKALCDQTKEEFKDQYYFVYCTYYQRDLSHIEMEAVNDETSYYLRKHGIEEEYHQDHWHSVPVTVTDEFYGLRVFGLGELDTLEWKVIASSLKLAHGLVSDTFDSHIEAALECHDRLASEDLSSVQFIGARCRVLQEDSGSYYYQIVTQNPLANEKKN